VTDNGPFGKTLTDSISFFIHDFVIELAVQYIRFTDERLESSKSCCRSGRCIMPSMMDLDVIYWRQNSLGHNICSGFLTFTGLHSSLTSSQHS